MVLPVRRAHIRKPIDDVACVANGLDARAKTVHRAMHVGVVFQYSFRLSLVFLVHHSRAPPAHPVRPHSPTYGAGCGRAVSQGQQVLRVHRGNNRRILEPIWWHPGGVRGACQLHANFTDSWSPPIPCCNPCYRRRDLSYSGASDLPQIEHSGQFST